MGSADLGARRPVDVPDPTGPGVRRAGPVPTIQSHGFLLAVDPDSGVIEVASANLRGFVGVEAGRALGRSLADVLGTVVASRLPVHGPGRSEADIRTVRLPPRGEDPGVAGADADAALSGDARADSRADAGGGGAAAGAGRAPWEPYEVLGHREGRLWVVEFEPTPPQQAGLRSLYDSFRRTLDHPRDLDTVTARCQAAAHEVRALTGYDRVLVYRFDTRTQGEVIAEARAPDAESFLGRSFPDRAVPTRSRDSYLHLVHRLVADVDDDGVELVARRGPAGGGGLALVGAALASDTVEARAHLRSLGIAAIMTVPLVVDGRLWGLLACHHRTPRRASHDVRAACDMLGRLLSLEVRSAQVRAEHERLVHLGGMVVEVVTAMSLAPSLSDGAAQVPAALLGMVAADGVVLDIDGTRATVGAVPAAADLEVLADRVAALAGRDEVVWSTDALPALLEAAGISGPPSAALTTGVLFLPFGGSRRNHAMWVRGADPDAAAADGGTASAPWLPPELAAAVTFANAVPALQLHRTHRVLAEQELRSGADRSRAETEKQALEHQLQQHQRLESLGQLAGGVAHDFNNLLAVILSYVELIGDEVDLEAGGTDGARWPAVQADVRHVKAATRRAADLTHQLLAFARREVVRPQTLDLNDVVRDLEDLLRRTIGENVGLVTDLAADLDPVLADPGQVEQVLVNLAVNARDAMRGGGTLTIATATTEVSSLQLPAPGAAASAAATWASTSTTAAAASSSGVGEAHAPAAHPVPAVELTVRDTGTGMPQAVVDRVFEPFFTTKATGEGTGLGLATVHGIVRQAGGSIAIDSHPGRGTTFSMVFPAARAGAGAVLTVPVGATRLGDADAVPAVTPAPGPSGRPGPPGAQPGQGGTVLVVEDGDDLREVTHRLLDRAGYHVLTAADGFTALELARAHPVPVDLLLTDLNMPLMTGDEVVGRMRELQPGVRVLLMTGYAEPVAPGGRSRPDLPTLAKPFTRTVLLARIAEVLDAPPATAGPDGGGDAG